MEKPMAWGQIPSPSLHFGQENLEKMEQLYENTTLEECSGVQ